MLLLPGSELAISTLRGFTLCKMDKKIISLILGTLTALGAIFGGVYAFVERFEKKESHERDISYVVEKANTELAAHSILEEQKMKTLAAEIAVQVEHLHHKKRAELSADEDAEDVEALARERFDKDIITRPN